MPKKLTRKEKIALQQKGAPLRSEAVPFTPKVEALKKTHLSIGLIIAILGFVFYANTLHHEYVLDDFSLIKENFQTKKGTAALKEIFTSSYRTGYYLPDNDLYRPLSKAMFAVEWQLAPDKPALSHWVNVLLYALTGFLLFYVLLLYLPDRMWLCALTALLFIAHPVHTEVVANIKSRDEILSFLFFLFCALAAIKYIRTAGMIWLSTMGISFFLCLLSKESAITFMAAIPLMAYFFTETTKKKQVLLASVLAGIALLFFIIRARILGSGPGINPSIMDNLLVGAHSKLLQVTTAIAILGVYLKLLILPHPLVSDYSFNQLPLAGLTDWHFILSFVIYTSLAVLAFLKFRQKNMVSFGILFFFITISVASNIVMLIGTSFGERLLYAPSLGFCMILAYGLTRLFKVEEKDALSFPSFLQQYPKLVALTSILLLLFFAKTYSRNEAWKSNYTLHSTDVLLSPNSARAHYYYGNIITQDEYLAKIKDPVARQATLDTSMQEMRRTVQIYPLYADAFHKIGKIYLLEKQMDSAAFYYKKALDLNPGNSMYLNNYGTVLFNQGRLEEARKEFELSLKTNPNQSDAYSNLGSVYGTMGQQLVAQHKPEEAQKSYETAISNFKKAIELAPEYASGYYMLGLTYRNIGDEAHANQYIDMAKRLNPSLH